MPKGAVFAVTAKFSMPPSASTLVMSLIELWLSKSPEAISPTRLVTVPERAASQTVEVPSVVFLTEPSAISKEPAAFKSPLRFATSSVNPRRSAAIAINSLRSKPKSAPIAVARLSIAKSGPKVSTTVSIMPSMLRPSNKPAVKVEVRKLVR